MPSDKTAKSGKKQTSTVKKATGNIRPRRKRTDEAKKQVRKAVPKHPFAHFDFSEILLERISEAGFSKPTPIQSQAIPVISDGHDVLAQAETGSGKTAAYVLPLIDAFYKNNRPLKSHYLKTDQWAKDNKAQTQRPASISKPNSGSILVLVPTRELALQIRNAFHHFAKKQPHSLKSVAVFGGMKIDPQIALLRRGVDVLIATPSRLLDLAAQKAVRMNQFKTLVVDEVDRLVSDGFNEEIDTILHKLPAKRQNLMFTATFPESIRTLVRQVLKNPEIINIESDSHNRIDQHVYTVNRNRKLELLARLLGNDYLDSQQWQQVLVFCTSKRRCDLLVKQLAEHGIEAAALHGNRPQPIREKTLRHFKAGRLRILIATDVAARGLDIEQLSCVINYELPRMPNDYLHRIGRTGRAGRHGTVLTLISHHEYAHFGVIERRNGLQLAREQFEDFAADPEAPPPPNRPKKKKPANKTGKHRKNQNRNKRASQSVRKQKSDESGLSSAKQKQTTKPAEKRSDTGKATSAPVNAAIWGKKK